MLKKSEDYAGKWQREISPEAWKSGEKVFQILSDMMNERGRSSIYDTELKDLLKEGGASDKFEFAKSVLSVMDFRVVPFAKQDSNDPTKNDYWLQKEDEQKTIKRLGARGEKPKAVKVTIGEHVVTAVPAEGQGKVFWHGYLDNKGLGRFDNPNQVVEAAKKKMDSTKAAAYPEKSKVLDTNQMPVVQTPDGSFHFVSHELKIVTPGFSSEDNLRKNASGFLATDNAMNLMRKRYIELYETGGSKQAAYITQNFPNNVDVNSFTIGDRVMRIWDSHGVSGTTPYEGKVADLSPTTYQVMVVWPWSIEYEDPAYLVNLSKNSHEHKEEDPVQFLTTEENIEAAEKEAEDKVKEMAKASQRVADKFKAGEINTYTTHPQQESSSESCSDGTEMYNTGPHPTGLESSVNNVVSNYMSGASSNK